MYPDKFCSDSIRIVFTAWAVIDYFENVLNLLHLLSMILDLGKKSPNHFSRKDL